MQFNFEPLVGFEMTNLDFFWGHMIICGTGWGAFLGLVMDACHTRFAPIVTCTMSTRVRIHISLLYIIWSLPNGRSLRPPVFLGEWDPKLCLEEIQIGQRTEAC